MSDQTTTSSSSTRQRFLFDPAWRFYLGEPAFPLPESPRDEFPLAHFLPIGIMDTCGFPKDNYYYYQSWWSDHTVLHILPHWNWPGCEGKVIDV